jgi:hypothetical protein
MKIQLEIYETEWQGAVYTTVVLNGHRISGEKTMLTSKQILCETIEDDAILRALPTLCTKYKQSIKSKEPT